MPINGRRPSLCTAFSGWKLLGCVAILNWHLPLYKHSSQEAEVWVLVKVCWNIIFLLSEDRNRPGMGWWPMGLRVFEPMLLLEGPCFVQKQPWASALPHRLCFPPCLWLEVLVSMQSQFLLFPFPPCNLALPFQWLSELPPVFSSRF